MTPADHTVGGGWNVAAVTLAEDLVERHRLSGGQDRAPRPHGGTSK